MLFRALSIVLLILCLNFLWGIRPVNYTLAALLIIWTTVSIRGMASMRSQGSSNPKLVSQFDAVCEREEPVAD